MTYINRIPMSIKGPVNNVYDIEQMCLMGGKCNAALIRLLMIYIQNHEFYFKHVVTLYTMYFLKLSSISTAIYLSILGTFLRILFDI